MWKDKRMQKAAEGTSLGHAKMLLQNKSLRFSFLNTIFLNSQTVFSLQPNCLSLPIQILGQALNHTWVKGWSSPGDASLLAEA